MGAFFFQPETKIQNADFRGQLEAVSKAQAVIEFNLDGTIITANENFLQTVGYSLDEIKGQHHRMFVEPEHARGAEYREFWEKLNRGEFEAGEYKRIGKGGKEVWIQASYNPILDLNGNPFKVVKYATDITESKKAADNASRLQSAVEGSGTAQMQVDRDLIITYVNPATVAMVKENLEHFEKAFRGFDLDNLIGECIDKFHAKPEHQRKILSDPKNLPFNADIKVGPLTFSLNVSAMTDNQGNYIGNCLE